jgi:hypothetical protein
MHHLLGATETQVKVRVEAGTQLEGVAQLGDRTPALIQLTRTARRDPSRILVRHSSSSFSL